MFTPSVLFPAAQSENFVSFTQLPQVPVVLVFPTTVQIAEFFSTRTHQYMGTGVAVQVEISSDNKHPPAFISSCHPLN